MIIERSDLGRELDNDTSLSLMKAYCSLEMRISILGEKIKNLKILESKGNLSEGQQFDLEKKEAIYLLLENLMVAFEPFAPR
jgi:hypothetical protein